MQRDLSQADITLNATQPYDVFVVSTNQAEAVSKTDVLLVEAPVAIIYNGISYATMLVTPVDLENFATGFSITEGIIGSVNDLRGIDIEQTAQGWMCLVEISPEQEWKLKERKRALAGRTGCGLCGVETLEQIHRVNNILDISDTPPMPLSTIASGFEALKVQQTLFAVTGAAHAAAFLDRSSQKLIVAEDVGRHNALDKLIGSLYRTSAPLDMANGVILVTSRASYEMVQKTVIAGISMLAAVSAPTALAIEEARRARLTLLGFCRQSSAVVYSYSERLQMVAA